MFLELQFPQGLHLCFPLMFSMFDLSYIHLCLAWVIFIYVSIRVLHNLGTTGSKNLQVVFCLCGYFADCSPCDFPKMLIKHVLHCMKRNLGTFHFKLNRSEWIMTCLLSKWLCITFVYPWASAVGLIDLLQNKLSAAFLKCWTSFSATGLTWWGTKFHPISLLTVTWRHQNMLSNNDWDDSGFLSTLLVGTPSSAVMRAETCCLWSFNQCCCHTQTCRHDLATIYLV